jgi:hypothetical protein
MASYSVLEGEEFTTRTPIDARDIVSVDNASDFNMTSDNTSQTTTPRYYDTREFGPLEDFQEFWIMLFINRNCLRVIAAIGFPANILRYYILTFWRLAFFFFF